ncbi:hypothetical protein [Streptomyces sp.]|uniref:hypothetical protein n=1 Tax=Streptomyces sp. TaxID=1931 RepID=UPI002F95DC92
MPRNSNLVKITHPGGLESEVDERSLRHWEGAGWSRADATSLDKGGELPPATVVATTQKPEPVLTEEQLNDAGRPRGRRTNKQED